MAFRCILRAARASNMRSWAMPIISTTPSAATQAERVNTDTSDLRDGLMAGQGMVIADDVEHGPNQQVIAPGCVNAPLSGALKQDSVDVVIGAAEKAIAHRPWASSANRARSRAIALSWSAWLSPGVATVT